MKKKLTYRIISNKVSLTINDPKIIEAFTLIHKDMGIMFMHKKWGHFIAPQLEQLVKQLEPTPEEIVEVRKDGEEVKKSITKTDKVHEFFKALLELVQGEKNEVFKVQFMGII